MTRKLLLATVLLFAATVCPAYCDMAPEHQALVWYMGNADPSATNSAGPGYKFIQRAHTTNLGTLVADPDAYDGLAWHITDDSPNLADLWRIGPEVRIGWVVGATILARVKVVSETDGPNGESCGNIRIFDTAAGNTCETHWGGPTGHIKETMRGNEATVAGDDQYHIVRMTVKDRGYGITALPYLDTFDYPDGDLVGNAGWEGDAEADDIGVVGNIVRITTSEDPEGKNRSAIQRVLADPDNEGCLHFSIKIKGANPALYGSTWSLYVEDPNGANLARWYGGDGSARPRSGGWGIVGPNQQLSGGWDTLRVKIDTTTKISHYYYTPGAGEGAGVEVELGTGLDYTAGGANNPEPMIGRVHFERTTRPASSVPAGTTIDFDDISVNGAPTSAALRTIKIYIDEDKNPAATEVIKIQPAYPMADNLNGFGFGANSEPAMQDIYFDWVTASNRGAFAPGEEQAVIGHSLVPGAATPVTTIKEAKTAPDMASVLIENAIVSAPFLDDNDNAVVIYIQEDDRSAGIGVLSDRWDIAPGQRVKVFGATTTVNGERILVGEMEPLPEEENQPKPIAMNNTATGGGPLGPQPAVLTFPGATEPCLWDSFDFSDGALAQKRGWGGNALGSEIAVENGMAKVIMGPSSGQTSVERYINAGPSATASWKIRAYKGEGSRGSNMWRLFLWDNSHREIAQWYGTWHSAQPRLNGIVGDKYEISETGTDLEVKVDFGTQTCDYYVDGAKVWSASYTLTGAGPLVGAVSIEHYNQVEVPNEYIYFDNLSLGSPAQAASGASNTGLLITIFGKVTAANDTGDFANGYFYVDDGSDLRDGTVDPVTGAPNIGIKCRPAAEYGDQMQQVPAVGSTVAVTGIMRIHTDIRDFWTWSFAIQD